MTSELARHFSPTGRLRASINLGNPILANVDPAGAPCGISVDLARMLAQRLGLELEPVVFDAAGKAADALKNEAVDVGFLAIDPVRAESISFTPPYVQIEGAYLVRDASPLQRIDEVDRATNRVVVGKGSAYDLFLTREIKQAQILRAPTSPTVVDTFIESGAEVAAGVRQQLEADAARIGGLRLLPGRFMVIHQAMGMPRTRNPEALAYLISFIEEMKQSGFVAAAMERHGIAGASVAPPGYPSDDAR
jgi:polar amino acid transport system substrate-binding protein